jgi:hypothetical protein
MTDLHPVEAALGLPVGVVPTVERRSNGDYAVIIDSRRLAWLVVRREVRYGDVRWAVGRRVVRISRAKVHGRRSRHAFVTWWLLTFGVLLAPEDVDQLRAAIIRASHRGTALQAQREVERRWAA